MPQPLPNLHHLELFYHVVKAGGITAATRSMPYGIQQPAVSGQITSLEKELGVRLFQRRPFTLTPAGQELYGFIAPFFTKLPEVASKIAGKASCHLRLAAPAMLIREHLPKVLVALRKSNPRMELSLMEAGQLRTLELLELEEIDLAIAELENNAPPGIQCEILATLPMVLLIPEGVKIPKGGIHDLVDHYPLIRPPANTAVSRLFSKGLERAGLKWDSKIEVTTIDLVQAYVSQGFGIGVSVQAPGVKFAKDIRVLDLNDFPQLIIAGLWRGQIHPLARKVVDGLKKMAKG